MACTSKKRAAVSAPTWGSTLGRWVCLETSGEGPCPRSGHHVVQSGNTAFLFGGCGHTELDKLAALNDAYSFNLETHQWQLVKVNSEPPTARSSFSMCAPPDGSRSIFVAGGTGADPDSLCHDIVEFDTHARTWSRVVDVGDTPWILYGQSQCAYGGSLILFGGTSGLEYVNDLYEIDIKTRRWRKLTTTGSIPSPRYQHQAIVVGDSMYVIGGGAFMPQYSVVDVYCLNLITLVWKAVNTSGEAPQSRVAHTCSFDGATDTILMWGGFSSTLHRLQDFHILHCSTATWTTETSNQPPPRAFHAACFHKGALYLFCGADGDNRYNDVWRYTVRESPPSLGVLAARQLRATEGDDEKPVKPRKNHLSDNAATASRKCISQSAGNSVQLPAEVASALCGFNKYATSLSV
ncbi:hypothetical protein JKP88DRAFT_163519 [Tribonema minus]|uniref:Uncharacterized protein n=1 Tax=Tribonema minus TaxID=303371 RepID=A0A835Z314_9STRA|nr:hypothetical protein JKP88DRAFT_163519 [Tribonema minus]